MDGAMDRLRELLNVMRQHNLAQGHFLGLLNVLIGRRVSRADGTEVSTGQTWRETAALLKRAHWDREAVREIGLDPADLPPRDRVKYWYTAITRAGVNTEAATAAGDRLATALQGHGYVVGSPPGR
jgi:hypothetical protein